jgi:uracil-DNA glycosylase
MRDSKWDEILSPIINSPQITTLKNYIKEERKTKIVIPTPNETFEAFNYFKYDELKIVIIGREPSANPLTGHGLAFSSKDNSVSEELRIIFKAIHKDIYNDYSYSDCFKNGNLYSWVRQGILLLNPILTVESGVPSSHINKGWEYFTEEILKSLNNYPAPIVFIFMGQRAQKFASLITKGKNDFQKVTNAELYKFQHLIITTPYPSEKTQEEFIETGVFERAMEFLIQYRTETQSGIQLITPEVFELMFKNIKDEYRKNKYPIVQGCHLTKFNIFERSDMIKQLKFYFPQYSFINLTT